jgi:hypothetical protein
MALFTVYAYLALSKADSQALHDLAHAAQALHDDFTALLAKLDQPEVPPALEAAAAQLGVTTDALTAALAAAKGS